MVRLKLSSVCAISLLICSTVTAQLLRSDVMNLGTYNPETKHYEKKSTLLAVGQKRIGEDDHDRLPNHHQNLGGDDHDKKPHHQHFLGGGNHDLIPHRAHLLGEGDHDMLPHHAHLQGNNGQINTDNLLGRGNHNHVAHHRQNLGGDDHDKVPHHHQNLGGGDHDLKPHGQHLLGRGDHDKVPHHHQNLGGGGGGGDDHDKVPHHRQNLGGGDHDKVPHHHQNLGGGDHDLKPHGQHLLGGGSHDKLPHHRQNLGGHNHDKVPHHRQNLGGGDDHDKVPHHRQNLDGDDHDKKPHGQHLLGGDDHDRVVHRPVLGKGNHKKKPHGTWLGSGDHDKKPRTKRVNAVLSFREFILQHNKSYEGQAEFRKRFSIFRHNLQRIRQAERAEAGSATYGITKFADLSEHEFRSMLGFRPELRKESEHRQRVEELSDVQLPVSFDWRDYNAVTPIKNQGMCGSCWAFSTTGNVEGQWALMNNQLVSLSEQELVDCDPEDHGCEGGLPENAYDAIIKLGGLESEDDYPYNGHDGTCHKEVDKARVTVNGSLELPQDEDQLARWLYKNGPISIGINANALQFYTGGVSHPLRILCNPKSLDHGMLIVGFGTHTTKYLHRKQPYWLIKNSWGTDWGEQGYYRVYRGDGTCGVNLMATSSIVP